MGRLRLALAQTNPTLGDLRGNTLALLEQARAAASGGADVMVTGEMAVTGYPIEDLASRPSFLRASVAAVDALAENLDRLGLGSLVMIVGHPDGPHSPTPDAVASSPTAIARNAASVLHGGKIVATYAKHHLPNYSVFDEYRNFQPGVEPLVVRVQGVDIAVAICEDIWRDPGPLAALETYRPGVLAVLNGSPYERDKDEVRMPLAARRAKELDTTVAYVNLVGGQDDLVFDGESFVVAPDGTLLARARAFEEELLFVDIDAPDAVDGTTATGLVEIPATARDNEPAPLESTIAQQPGDLEQVWSSLRVGLRDYVEKNGFRSVILGLSGGIDSAVCAALAADAIGGDRVYGVSMPSRYSSDHSRSDADDLAARLGLHYSTEAIADLVAPVEQQLDLSGVAAENLQARIRGLILMSLSNMHGHLVLTTGNKTELSVGYSTIYGDSVGGFAPLKDVPKLLVRELARWRNDSAIGRGETPPIPENTITKPPSAELRPDQVDEDSLPPYEVLDPLLDAYVTRGLGAGDVAELGFDAELVDSITTLVDRSEWKRRQGAIGPRISGMAFGRDRRLPITYRPSQA